MAVYSDSEHAPTAWREWMLLAFVLLAAVALAVIAVAVAWHFRIPLLCSLVGLWLGAAIWKKVVG